VCGIGLVWWYWTAWCYQQREYRTDRSAAELVISGSAVAQCPWLQRASSCCTQGQQLVSC